MINQMVKSKTVKSQITKRKSRHYFFLNFFPHKVNQDDRNYREFRVMAEHYVLTKIEWIKVKANESRGDEMGKEKCKKGLH